MTFGLRVPATPEEAVRELARGPSAAAALAGGTDLLFELGGARPGPPVVVSLRRMPWRTVAWDGPALVIGATAPLARLEDDPRVARELPGLADAVRAVGSRELRHRATVGGNVARASPASDLLPILLALDAAADLVGPAGPRECAVGALVTGPRRTALAAGELIAAVRVPEGRPSAYLWQRVRPSNDVSQVGVAVARSPTAGRWSVAVGGAGPTTVRLPDAERELGDAAAPAPAAVARAAEVAAERAPFATDRRASEAYRRQVLGVLLTRAVGRAGGRA